MADAKVLEAQQWVNATYSSVAGYQRCAEDGFTGWNTMYSLTMGLQHELGITVLAAAFGPTTLQRLTQYGNIVQGEPNVNIVNIARYALWCKGYPGGYVANAWDGYTTSSIMALRDDAGLTAEPVITPKVFKAMLSMDAYKTLLGGHPRIRDAQRWLNGRYVDRSTFFIGPCDGHFSRNVQKSLMTAIQYEVGIPEAEANGVFGPGTKNGLKSRFDPNAPYYGSPLRIGHTGVFVRLFSAACVFNGFLEVTVDGVTNSVRAPFTDTFDDELETWVWDFQEFSAIHVSGTGTYESWAELLVSTGDPDRPVDACDTWETITPARAQALRNDGFFFVGRYLEEYPTEGSLPKKIDPGELEAIFGAGLSVAPIWQMRGNSLASFKYSNGLADGRAAHAAALEHGFGRSTVIYFAVDYDATDPEITSNIVPYFRGVYQALGEQGRRYVPGVYGSRNVCGRVSAEAYTRFSYVSGMSYGYSGNLGFPLPPNWAFNQIQEIENYEVGSETIPLDRVAHRPGSDPGASAIDGDATLSSLEAVHQYLDTLYQYAAEYGDGQYDRNELVLQYLRAETYAEGALGLAFEQIVGPYNSGWIAYAGSMVGRPQHWFTDPYTGVKVELDHWGASTNGYYNQGAGTLTQANRGDFGGWAGDLIAFYAEWMTREAQFASGYEYCMQYLANMGVHSEFAFGNLVEDVDGYVIGMALRNAPTVRLQDLFLLYYMHGYGAGRFDSFYQQRFGSSLNNVRDAARYILGGDLTDVPMATIRLLLIENIGGPDTPFPWLIPGEKINSFIDGWVDKLAATLRP